ncbi:DUF6443 domain-containing protein [Paradesertivirga mongoliensis]|uniref:DUF6443 domain-containing protein n=1 Tax=Paradesertivirga mongoliensis TaxID=2100740 RepID=A0ABW4ZJP8_9SPHI|nr:DUF6443 domain-containing protein [Pedobacter mongoliensis]
MKKTLGFLTTFLVSIVAASYGQTSSLSGDKNYVVTYTPRVEGITIPSQISGKPANEVNQNVQYFDGLGRPMQTVETFASPGKKDIIQHITYDAYGREAKKYLPYTEGTSYGTYRSNALSSQSSFYNNGANHGVVTIPSAGGITPSFAETKFEPSPLNRVVEQGAPGGPWQLASGHTIKTEYGANTTNEVQLWSVTSNGATTNGAYYPANSLYKTTIKDENWTSNQVFPLAGISEEFKDKSGQTVLKRTYNVKDNALQTLSTYYIYDDLDNLVYVIPPGASPASFTEGDAIFNQYIYAYHYDHRNRVVEKKIPAKGWEYMVYNKLDQVVMSQDANQRSHANQDWLVTKYDAHGREVFTGIWVHNGSTANGSYRTGLQSNVDNQAYQWDIRQSGGNGYTNSLSEYRTYPQTINTTLTLSYYDDYNFPGNSFGGSSVGQSPNVTTLLTGTKTAILGSSTMLLTVSYYDGDGRVIQKKSENHLGGTDIVNNTYSFTDELLTSTRIHTVNGNTTTIADRYEYDHAGRKKKSFQQIGGTEVTLSNSDYNEAGQLKTKELHSANNSAYIHNTQYSYNERGWKRTIAGSKFNLTLAYDTDILTGATPSFNGNITEARYTTDHSGTNQIRYEYDKANRLIRSVHAQGVLTEDNIQYDLMGNIQYLERGNYGNLSYTYNGNQLSSVSGYLNKTYSDYDANGNMRADGTKQYFYNILNLPSLVQHQGGGTILTYTYDAERNKLQSTGSTGTWDYLDGIHYQNNQLKFINNEEGRAVYNSSAGTFKYEYALEDHLGNARVYIDESGGQARVIQEDEYYSFGLRRGRYDYASNNRYLYNGKELQDEIGMYDYGARFYDPAIGRWHSVDPRVEEDDEWSPYNYVRNNPVLYNDPDGELWNVVIGAAIGAAVDYGTQVAGNMVAGKSLSQSLTQVDGRSIAASAVLGGITSGASALGVGGAKATVIVGARAARAIPKVTTAQKVVAKTATTAKRVVEKAKENRAEAASKGIPQKQLGPSGKPKIHTVEKSNLKSAKDAARNNPKSNTAPTKHSSDKGQKTHYHSTKDNEKLKGKDNVHYVDRSSKKNPE